MSAELRAFDNLTGVSAAVAELHAHRLLDQQLIALLFAFLYRDRPAGDLAEIFNLIRRDLREVRVPAAADAEDVEYISAVARGAVELLPEMAAAALQRHEAYRKYLADGGTTQ